MSSPPEFQILTFRHRLFRKLLSGVKCCIGTAVDFLEEINGHEARHASGALRVVEDFCFDVAVSAKGYAIFFDITPANNVVAINDVMSVQRL